MELKALGDTAETRTGHSYMKSPNLEEAIQITELDLSSNNPEAEKLLTKNLNSVISPKKGLLVLFVFVVIFTSAITDSKTLSKMLSQMHCEW